MFGKGNEDDAKITEASLLTDKSQTKKKFERIIYSIIEVETERELNEEQYGFRSNTSTGDLLFSIYQMMEKGLSI